MSLGNQAGSTQDMSTPVSNVLTGLTQSVEQLEDSPGSELDYRPLQLRQPTQLDWMVETQPMPSRDDEDQHDEEPPPAYWPEAENEVLRAIVATIKAQIKALITDNADLTRKLKACNDQLKEIGKKRQRDAGGSKSVDDSDASEPSTEPAWVE